MESIFDIFKRKKKPEEERAYRDPATGLWFALNSTSISSEQSLRLGAVYAAVTQISNAVACLDIDIKAGDEKIKHPLGDLLTISPDPRLNGFQFRKLITQSLLLRGNGYAYIERDENLNCKHLWYLSPDDVTPSKTKEGDIIYYIRSLDRVVGAYDMIHLWLHVDANFNGISVIKYAADTLNGASAAERTANNFFKSGGKLAGILKIHGNYSDETRKQVKESWQSSFGSETDKVPVALLPQNIDYQSVSVNPVDADLLNNRRYSIVQIAQFFNISPLKLYDLTHTSYNTLEQTQLAFLQDTILPITKAIEAEFNKKLFKPSQVGQKSVVFNFKSLMATNKQEQAAYYKELLVNGIMTCNEVRKELGLSPVEDGDDRVMQMSYTTFDNIKAGTYISDKTDNQLKTNKEEEKDK